MTDLLIRCEEIGQALMVRLSGEFDEAGAGQFRAAVDGWLARTGAVRLCVDLSGLTFVDSAGIGALLGRYRRLLEAGGAMAMTGAPPAVRGLLDLSGVLRVIPLYDNEQQALRGA